MFKIQENTLLEQKQEGKIHTVYQIYTKKVLLHTEKTGIKYNKILREYLSLSDGITGDFNFLWIFL